MGARVTVARATPTRFFCPPLRLGRHALLEAGERHAREALGDARAHLVLRRGVEAPQREGDVVEDRQVVEERVVLEEHPDALADVLQRELRGVGDRVVADADGAAVGPHQAGDHLEQDALAARAGPDEPVEAPLGHGQADVAKDGPRRPPPAWWTDLSRPARRITSAPVDSGRAGGGGQVGRESAERARASRE